MRWLLWKDYRQNLLILLLGLFFLLAPYVAGIGIGCGAHWIKIGTHDATIIDWNAVWTRIFAIANAYSLALSQMTMALLGGHALASERADRSAEFLFSLPIRRRDILLGKILLALLVAAVIWVTNVPVMWYLAMTTKLPPGVIDIQENFHVLALGGLLWFCVAWFLSSLTRSPALAAFGGLISPFLLLGSLGFISYFFEIPFHPVMELWYFRICFALPPVLFVVGTWLYLRRVEP